MKKHIIILFIPFLIACNRKTITKQDKAQELVKSYLNKNLDDSTSYQPGTFRKIDGITESQFSGENVNYIRHGVLPPDTTNHKGFYGYTLVHEYRAKNKLGVLVKEDKIFYLDTGLTRVIVVQ